MGKDVQIDREIWVVMDRGIVEVETLVGPRVKGYNDGQHRNTQEYEIGFGSSMSIEPRLD